MAEVTTGLIKSLRELTGAGLMECKRALVEAAGNIDEAALILRKSGQAKALKKAGRLTSEGKIGVCIAPDRRTAAIVEVNCETDFVAKDDNFTHFVQQVAKTALAHQTKDKATLDAAEYVGEAGKTVETARQGLVTRVGENITLRRVTYLQTPSTFHSYVHHGDKIGVLVEIEAGEPSQDNTAQGGMQIGRRIAMHIAASTPLVLDHTAIPESTLEKERAVYRQQVQKTGRSAEIIEKIVENKVQDFISNVALLSQKFVQDPSLSVKQKLDESGAKVFGFVRFEVGETVTAAEEG